MNSRQLINFPNALTCCNLLAGCVAVLFTFNGDPLYAFILIIVGAVFDFFDGFAARKLKVSSPIGKELDSLADVITFGFAPAALTYETLTEARLDFIFPLAAFLLVVFSALRLAKFNLDERQTTSFLGLPTPANALFWSALACSLNRDLLALPFVAYGMLLLIFASCALLVSEIPMFSLKFKNFSWGDNKIRYLFLIVSAAFIVMFGMIGVSIAMLWYVFLSLLVEKR